MLIDLLIASDEDGEDVDTFMAIKDINSFSHRLQKDLQSSTSSFLREAVSYSKMCGTTK